MKEVIIQTDYIGNKCFYRAKEKQPLGYWKTISPTFIYRKCLLNWCKRNSYKVLKNKGQVFIS